MSCKKLIEVDLPIDKNTTEAIYAAPGSAIAVMSGIYARLSEANGVYTDEYGLSIRTALRADELTPVIAAGYPDYLNALSGDMGWSMWDDAYRAVIYGVNSLLEGVEKSTTLPTNIKVNFYGDIPLIVSTDYKVNSAAPRSPKQQVYEQIVKDLLHAQAGLKDDYLDSDLIKVSQERIRPNKLAATALLARVYLYMKDWQNAEAQADIVINNSNYTLLPNLNDVFIKNSKEAIWQLHPNLLDVSGVNTPDGKYFINPHGGEPFFYVSSNLLDAFEIADKRREDWITTKPSGTIIPYKYKEGWATTVSTEYTMVLRLAEQYLIRAEARAHLEKLTGPNSAKSDLDSIRSRAGLPGTTAHTQDELLNAIAHERQIELFTEWGQRWLDLYRTGKLDEVMSVVAVQKGTSWALYKALLPIPYDEFKYNTALRGHQNPGYLEQP
jgi:hypothetical protein